MEIKILYISILSPYYITMKHKNTILFFSVIFTIISIITWSHLLFNNKNNIEGLVDMENSSTTHTVNFRQ